MEIVFIVVIIAAFSFIVGIIVGKNVGYNKGFYERLPADEFARYSLKLDKTKDLDGNYITYDPSNIFWWYETIINVYESNDKLYVIVFEEHDRNRYIKEYVFDNMCFDELYGLIITFKCTISPDKIREDDKGKIRVIIDKISNGKLFIYR